MTILTSSDQKLKLKNKRHQRNNPPHDYYESHGNRWVVIPEPGKCIIICMRLEIFVLLCAMNNHRTYESCTPIRAVNIHRIYESCILTCDICITNIYISSHIHLKLTLSYISRPIIQILSSDASAAREHCGHLSLRPEHLHAEISPMLESQKQLARDCAQLSFNSSSTAALINIREGLGMEKINWKDSQIDSIRKVEKQDLSELTAEASSADRLISTFEDRDDVNYLYVTYRKDEGMLMMTQKERKQVRDIRRGGKDLIEERVQLDKLYEANRLSGDNRLLLFFCMQQKKK